MTTLEELRKDGGFIELEAKREMRGSGSTRVLLFALEAMNAPCDKSDKEIESEMIALLDDIPREIENECDTIDCLLPKLKALISGLNFTLARRGALQAVRACYYSQKTPAKEGREHDHDRGHDRDYSHERDLLRERVITQAKNINEILAAARFICEPHEPLKIPQHECAQALESERECASANASASSHARRLIRCARNVQDIEIELSALLEFVKKERSQIEIAFAQIVVVLMNNRATIAK